VNGISFPNRFPIFKWWILLDNIENILFLVQKIQVPFPPDFPLLNTAETHGSLDFNGPGQASRGPQRWPGGKHCLHRSLDPMVSVSAAEFQHPQYGYYVYMDDYTVFMDMIYIYMCVDYYTVFMDMIYIYMIWIDMAGFAVI
jgi:hypothetical protein